MNHDHPSAPLLPSQAADLIVHAGEFAEELPADQRAAFIRSVVTAVVGSLIEGARA